MRARALALVGLLGLLGLLGLACRGKQRADEASPPPADAAPAPAVPDRISGTLTLDGEPLAITRCRPGTEGPNVYVDLVTAAGALRFLGGQAAEMYWNPRPDANERGAPIACSIPHRSWGGGPRSDGTAYFRGELAFSCRGAAGALAGEVSLDCGNITAIERGFLDETRRQGRARRPAP